MILRIVVFVVLAVAVSHIARLVYLLGHFKTIHNHEPGPCRVVPGIDMGSEDITVTSNGLAFISSGLLSGEKGYHNDPRRQPPHLKGRIFVFDFNHPEKNVVEVTLNGDFDRSNFYPHGISLYEDKNSGEKRLFVVNHHISNQDRIEIFLFDEASTSLNHLKTVTGENIFSVNDVVAVGPETFYYTNDCYYVKHWQREIEIFGFLHWGTIGFYDGNDRLVASGLDGPNGINVSPNGRYLYVASPVSGLIMVFERANDNSIEEKQKIYLHTGIDNLEVDKTTGDLWIGGHPVLHQWVEHRDNITKPAGSHVLRIHLGSEKAPYDKVDIRQVFMNDGSIVSGSSAACYYDNQLLVGTVLQKMAYCEIRAF
ncbi:serum paraoxonase/arylesterase 2-like [Glandiceps talaboti]